MDKVELLSPAGDFESFVAAVQNGADAVYMGVSKFNARQMVKNLDLDSFTYAIVYAHIYGAKVYLTLNTLMYNSEIKEALEILIKLYSHGLDGVILQDIGLASLIHKILPKLPIHASTQMSVHNLKQVKYLESLGFSRVILARELTIDEIENICKNTNIQIEVFVHGALCVSYSGQCLLSSMIGGRSGNRGVCAGPCRMKYSLYNKQGQCIEKNRYLLSKKDIFGLEFVKKLSDIGVKSFKIEGRNKTAEYVALTTKIYRKYIDQNIQQVDQNDKEMLLQMFNRDGISTGYLDGVKHKESITLNSPKNVGLVLGKVLDQRKQYIKLELNQDISMHDGIEILDDKNPVSTIVTCTKDQNFKTVNNDFKKGNIVWLGDINKKVKFGSVVNKTSSVKLNEIAKKTYESKNNIKYVKKINVNLCIEILKNNKISAKIPEKNIECSLDYVPEIAIKKSIDKTYIKDIFAKTIDSPFEFKIDDKNIKLDDRLFVPVSKLNELRRKILDLLYNSYMINIDVKDITTNLDKYLYIKDDITKEKSQSQSQSKSKTIQNALYVYNISKSNYTDYINYLKTHKDISKIYVEISDIKNNSKLLKDLTQNSYELYICIPNIVNQNLDNYITENLENIIKLGIKGVIVANIGYIPILNELKQKYGTSLILNYHLNITNSYSALFYKQQNFDDAIISPELPNENINDISKILNVEQVKNYVDVMTSRYCILGSFIGYDPKLKLCEKPCRTNSYYMVDSFGKKYHLICDDTDCIMKIVKEFKKEYDLDKINNLYTIVNNQIL